MRKVQARPKGRCRSILEHDTDKELGKDKRARRFKSYSYETDSFDYVIAYKYIPDFTITRKDGSQFYLEVKGYLDQETRRKMRAVKECNPDMDIRFLFPKEQALPEGLQQTNVEWARKWGFPCCVGVEIPREWYVK